MTLEWKTIQHLDQPQWESLCANLRQNALYGREREETLTALRAALLARVSDGQGEEPRLTEFLSALAAFCRGTEFVFAVSPQEEEQLGKLSLGRSVAEDLIIGCYRAIEKDALPIADVERLSPIADDTSRAVQAMYEENPYPRWKQLRIKKQNDEALECLIAGCGSGRQIVTNALTSPRSRYVGIDLSLASLAYGLMKAREYNVSNARFIQADILDVARLGLSFDHISAVGSVHHMQNPVSGVRALAGVLKPGGNLKLALYSKMGRASVLAGIALRQALGLQPTADGIRALRQLIYSLPEEHPAKQVTVFEDFYSMSGCRDMLFHVQEHNYTMADIFELIDDSGLRLRDFAVPGHMVGAGLTRENLVDLEQKNPGFAGAMFRFVLVP